MAATTAPVKNNSRLEALARKYGADTHPRSADWEKPLPKMAREVYQEFTRPGGKNGYARFGKDIISPEEIVQAVYVVWARSEHVSTDWFDTLDSPGAMLRTFCQTAAQNLVNKAARGHRDGIFVGTTGFTGSGMTEDGEDGGKFDWLANSKEYASEYGQPEKETLDSDLEQRLELAIESIIDSIGNDTHRGIARMYYLDGSSVDDAADAYGVSKQSAQKALQRARAAVGEEDAACLIVWRKMQHTTEGRQSMPKARPVRLLMVLTDY